MKNLVFFIALFLNGTLLLGQDISVYTEENDKITSILAKNSSSKLTYAVTITLNAQGYKITQAPPFEVTLKPGEVKEVVKLIEKPGEKMSMEYQVSYKKVAGQNEPDLTHLKVMPKDTIYVFSGNQCSRSEAVLKKLKEVNKISKELHLGDQNNYELLRDVLAAQLKPGQLFNFYTPVVVVNSVPITDPKKVDEWMQTLNIK